MEIEVAYSFTNPCLSHLEVNCAMRYRVVVGAALALLACNTLADDAFKSGPQPGDKIGTFDTLNVTGSNAGKKNCLI